MPFPHARNGQRSTSRDKPSLGAVGEGQVVRWWERTGVRQFMPDPQVLVSSLLRFMTRSGESLKGSGPQHGGRMRKAQWEIRGARGAPGLAAAGRRLVLTPDSRIPFSGFCNFGGLSKPASSRPARSSRPIDSRLRPACGRGLPFRGPHLDFRRWKNPYRAGCGPVPPFQLFPIAAYSSPR